MKPISKWGLLVVMAALAFPAVGPRGRIQLRGQASKNTAPPSANAEEGKRLFMKDGCYECHGMEGQGSVVTGPRLAPNPSPLEAFLFYVRKPTGQMPPYTTKVLSARELSDIHAFLESIPQPPAVNSLPLLKSDSVSQNQTESGSLIILSGALKD